MSDDEAFAQFVHDATGRDMNYHVRAKTTGIEFALTSWQAALRFERRRIADELTAILAEAEGVSK